jgi:hypothetical protein
VTKIIHHACPDQRNASVDCLIRGSFYSQKKVVNNIHFHFYTTSNSVYIQGDSEKFEIIEEVNSEVNQIVTVPITKYTNVESQ